MSFFSRKSKLEAALSSAQAKGGFAEALEEGHEVDGQRDVAALAAALSSFRPLPATDRDLHALVALFQQPANEETAELLRRLALPHLVRVYDDALRLAAVAPGRKRDADGEDGEGRVSTLVFVLKILALYHAEAAVERIAQGIRRFPDEYLWSVVFEALAEEDHPLAPAVVEALRRPLPAGFAGVAFLDLANTMCREDRLADHPYAGDEGCARLASWIGGAGADSYARSATAALPFVPAHIRGSLLEQAARHPSLDVRMEAAWAGARCGHAEALTTLAGWTGDPRTAGSAIAYLEELEREDLVPASCRTPEFEALTEMCSWLQHPAEFGRAPDAIELADSRELHWPPTRDRRRVFAVRYRYAGSEPGEEDDVGYGMVGSVTFALFGESTAELKPLEVYALHCCWELEANGDERCPPERSVPAGMKLLRAANRDLPGAG